MAGFGQLTYALTEWLRDLARQTAHDLTEFEHQVQTLMWIIHSACMPCGHGSACAQHARPREDEHGRTKHHLLIDGMRD